MGRPKGSKNKPRLHLASEAVDERRASSPTMRMQAQRQRVCLLVYDGMPPETIAAVMGLSLDKLIAIFSRELEHGAAIIRAEILERLQAAGEKGNVGATRALEGLGVPNELSPDLAIKGGSVRRGKKDLAQLKAESAEIGTVFEDLLK